MPGRGNYWKPGGLNDGVVTEADIDPTYQSTIEGGGGVDRENGADPFTDFWFYDEFFYPEPATGVAVHYERAVDSYTVPNNVTGGQVTITSSNVADNIARINTCGGGLSSIDSTKNFRLVIRSKLEASDSNTASRIGFLRNQGSLPAGTFPFASEPSERAWFELDGTGNWIATVDDGTTEQNTDTGVARDTNFHVFEIRSNPSTPSIEFLIDNSIVATFTTDLPQNDATTFIGVQTGTTATRGVTIDSVFIFQER